MRSAPSPTSRCCRRRRSWSSTIRSRRSRSATTCGSRLSATKMIRAGHAIVNTIDYRNTGMILRVVPRINVNGKFGSTSSRRSATSPPVGGRQTLTPTVSQRKVKSSIAVATGQTVLLAGLISERQERGRSGIPVLERFDWLGDAFSRSEQRRPANRTDHLHPSADHPRRRRCSFRG